MCNVVAVFLLSANPFRICETYNKRKTIRALVVSVKNGHKSFGNLIKKLVSY